MGPKRYFLTWYSMFRSSGTRKESGMSKKNKKLDLEDINVKVAIAFGLAMISILLLIIAFQLLK